MSAGEVKRLTIGPSERGDRVADVEEPVIRRLARRAETRTRRRISEQRRRHRGERRRIGRGRQRHRPGLPPQRLRQPSARGHGRHTVEKGSHHGRATRRHTFHERLEHQVAREEMQGGLAGRQWPRRPDAARQRRARIDKALTQRHAALTEQQYRRVGRPFEKRGDRHFQVTHDQRPV